ncbi:MAG: ubiquinone/menaquinone biosynthesis methyltransferase [Acidobacteriota bacterium]
MGDTAGQKVVDSAAPDLVAGAGGSFSGAVRRMFDGLAPRYDSFNHWASLGLDHGWRRATVSSLRLTPSDDVLDVATGTGDLAFATARAAQRAVGCDFAAEMIRHARRKATPADRAWFHVARAERLPYADNSFQGATSAFAMRNVKPMLPEVLGEMHRVLAPGGRVAILEFSRPRRAPVRWGHGLYTRVFMPRVGKWLTGTAEPFEYLYRSIQEWYAPDEFANMLRTAGFANVSYRMMGLGTVALHSGRKDGAAE